MATFLMKLIGFLLFAVLKCNTLADKANAVKSEGIIGGSRADDDQFKYYVSFQYYGIHRCGGAIIDDQFAITAAHCVFKLNDGSLSEGPFSILAADINAVSPHLFAVRRRVIEAFVPSAYVPMCLLPDILSRADIAVLKLSHKLELDARKNKLSKLRIPVEQIREYNTSSIITGQGYTGLRRLNTANRGFGRYGYGDGLLRFAETEIVPNEICNMTYRNHIHDDHICARVIQRSTNVPAGTCGFDSGGPLVYNGENLIGILSGGPDDCNETIKPAIYTNPSYYWSFIDNVLRGQITPDMRHIIYNLRIG